ncbi:RNA polymerase II transcription factor B 52 kDa subunit [Taxawa tesnikishii (nom. ined.)]|nr:RNA polymerase II transcription factor B 52 kDa subunit [Dothideales sp. JES 119]
MSYLEGQPAIIFNKLYQQPSTALAIFRRMLPHLGKWTIRHCKLTPVLTACAPAKNFVMAMLYMPTPFLQQIWIPGSNKMPKV